MRIQCIFILIILLLCTACQPTPETPLVMPKDQQIMLEKAAATRDPEDAYTPPTAPEPE